MANPKDSMTPSQQNQSNESSEVAKILLDVVRRVDREVKETQELSHQARKAVHSYNRIAKALAVREFTEDRADDCDFVSSPSAG